MNAARLGHVVAEDVLGGASVDVLGNRDAVMAANHLDMVHDLHDLRMIDVFIDNLRRIIDRFGWTFRAVRQISHLLSWGVLHYTNKANVMLV